MGNKRMGWALTVFQTAGAAAGFITAGIAIWTYLTKDRPTAVVVGAPLGGFGRRDSYLKVRNRSDRPILLIIQGGRPRTELVVWPDHETKSALYGIMSGTKTTITVEPQSEALLPLIRPSMFDDISDDSEMVATVDWAYAQPPFWRSHRPLKVTISKWAFNAVVAGVLREAGGDPSN